MVMFFITGLAMSLAHCIFYARLSGRIVGNSDAQEEKIRSVAISIDAAVMLTLCRFGTAFAFLCQTTLGACVWVSYTQW